MPRMTMFSYLPFAEAAKSKTFCTVAVSSKISKKPCLRAAIFSRNASILLFSLVISSIVSPCSALTSAKFSISSLSMICYGFSDRTFSQSAKNFSNPISVNG